MRTPLYYTLQRRGMENIFNLMLKKGVEVNQLCQRGDSILTHTGTFVNKTALLTLLRNGTNPLLGILDRSKHLPFTTTVQEYPTEFILLCEYGAGLIKSNLRFATDDNVIDCLDRNQKWDYKTSEKMFYNFSDSELILAARKKSDPTQITWVFSAERFKALLLDKDEEAILPQAEMICKHLKQAPQNENDNVSPEVRNAHSISHSILTRSLFYKLLERNAT